MTRTRYRIFETEYPYFLTCTIVGWLPVFARPKAVEIVLESWRYLQRERGLSLFGYVILENHLHMIASAPQLGTAMQNYTTTRWSAVTWMTPCTGGIRALGITRGSRG